jgi:hypothetical protein
MVMLALLLAAAAAAAPAPPAPPERDPWILEEFFLAGNAHPQDRHEVQVTWTLDHGREDDRNSTSAAVEVEYGITDRLQLEGEIPWQRVHARGEPAVTGWGEPELGLLYAIARGPRRLLSAGVDVELPDDEGEGADRSAGVTPYLIAGRRIGRGEVQAAFAYDLRRTHDLAYDVAGVGARGHWRGTLEMNGRREEGGSSLRLTPGVMWKGLRAYEVGIALPLGLRDAPRAGVVLKVDAEF